MALGMGSTLPASLGWTRVLSRSKQKRMVRVTSALHSSHPADLVGFHWCQTEAVHDLGLGIL